MSIVKISPLLDTWVASNKKFKYIEAVHTWGGEGDANKWQNMTGKKIQEKSTAWILYFINIK